MRLCIIGNSHVGMLRAALAEPLDDAPDCTFFAKAGIGIDKAVIRGSVIAAHDPELRAAQARFDMPQSIDIDHFDAVVIVAGTASIYTALTVLQAYRVSGWASAQIETAHAPKGDVAKPLISEPAFVAALADAARRGYAFRFAEAFRHASATPIFVVPQPYPNERVFESTAPREYGFHRARRHGEGPAITACLARAIDDGFSGIDALTILHQPADTIAHGFTTAGAFTRDAVRVDGQTAQQADDVLHVGPAFGRRVLAAVAAALGNDPAAQIYGNDGRTGVLPVSATIGNR